MFKILKRKVLIPIFIAVLLVIAIVFGLLFYNGILLINNPNHDRFPVRGVDLSSYQGEVDFNILAQNDIDFCFIKATEGSSFVDKKFNANYENAQKTELFVGAYHFFSFESGGKEQAEHFIKNVKVINKMLPPVVDLEFYGDFFKNKPEKEKVQKELNAFIDEIYKHYKIKPIIYATKDSYDLYLSGKYKEYDIWIRDILSSPKLSDGREWTFWQYTNRARLTGYSGREKYIDVNVFNGTKEEFSTKYKK